MPSMIDQKIKHGWGYDVGPFPPSVVLSHDGTNYRIEHWPTANPPTIEQIEAVVLPEPTPQADWPAFRLALAGSSAFLRVSTQHSGLFTLLALALDKVAVDATKISEVKQYWNLLAEMAQLTSVEITQLNAIATQSNILLQLNSAGLMQ